MMTLLARGLTWGLGSKLLLPALLAGLLVFGHQAWLGRDQRLRMAGKELCDKDWQIAIAKRERDATRRETEVVQELLEGERKSTERLTDDLKKLEGRFAALKETASTDPRCLSDGVLDILRR